jgi:hypothetical protein
VHGTIRIQAPDGTMAAASTELAEIFYSAIPRRMNRTPAEVAVAVESVVSPP